MTKLPLSRFHDLQHAVSLSLLIGVNLKSVQETPVHSHINMMLGTYPHALPCLYEKAMKKMDHLFKLLDDKRPEDDEEREAK
jgi:hypothetical protein